MLRIAALLLMLWPSAVLAQAPSAPEGLTWMVLRDINDAYFNQDDPTNRPPLTTVVPPGVIQAVEVSPDGQTDWLVDYEKAGVNAFCGTGGCVRRLYVSTPDGLVRAFDNQALSFEITGEDAGRRIQIAVHHTYCGLNQWDCRAAFRWDAATRKLVTTPLPGGRKGAANFDPLGVDD
jgi:hypothetical protein